MANATPHPDKNDYKSTRVHNKIQISPNDRIVVSPWVTDKEQKRFHDIKVEHDILRFKINTGITSQCLFRNIRRWGDRDHDILNHRLTEGSC